MKIVRDSIGPTHVAYADETNHNVGRFRALSLITLQSQNTERIRNEVGDILRNNSISEFKWSKLRSARERFAALQILSYVINQAKVGLLRVDTLVWDVEDSRHKVQSRSDIRNMRRMYYFLFRDILGKRWPGSAIWSILPDESSTAPWSHLGYLNEVWDWDTYETIFKIKISNIFPVQSNTEPLIQVADLFAGLAVYSRKAYDTYEKWMTVPLEPAAKATSDSLSDLSRADFERCYILYDFDKQCKAHKMGVSIRQNRGLRTLNPSNPINFWWYEPQTNEDIAPLWR